MQREAKISSAHQTQRPCYYAIGAISPSYNLCLEFVVGCGDYRLASHHLYLVDPLTVNDYGTGLPCLLSKEVVKLVTHYHVE